MNHIAIVEDDASIAEMLSFHMASQGYQTTHFADGEEARKNLMETDYDLVLLDIMLPNCNGLDICKALRQRSPTVPILMLTSLDREFDLLFYLVQNHGRVYSRSQLLDAIWGYSHDGYEHTINTHINRLRNKLKRSNGEPEFIQTVWGVGYKFVNPDQSAES